MYFKLPHIWKSLKFSHTFARVQKKIKIKVEWGIALPYLVPLTLIHYAICIAIQDSEHKFHLIS